jgi:hypothetical protein
MRGSVINPSTMENTHLLKWKGKDAYYLVQWAEAR